MSSRIILFGPLPPPHGGVSIYMKALLAHFAGPKVRVWSYTGRSAGHSNVRFVAHRRLGTISALIAEGRHARILDATHFHFEYPNSLLLTVWIVLKWLLNFEWYKNVLDGSLPNRYPQFGFLRRWLFHRALNNVDHFVVVSEDLQRWLREELRVRRPITVVPCLLPPPAETSKTLSSETARELEFYFAHARQVCSIGVFIPSYGFRDIAEAVEELRRRTGKDIGLLFLDGGFSDDEEYREEVLWERDWISVLEKIPNEDIYQILKRSDVFVRGPREEGYGISRVEALWSGIPVVATRTGETRGMLLYDFGNVEELVGQLQAVLLYPVQEEPNPWPARYRREAEENLNALANLLGVERDGDSIFD